MELPVALNPSNEEFQIPLDVSPYFPDDDPDDYVYRILDFDITRDGARLYASVYSKVVYYDVPAGGALREVIDLGYPVSKVRVSPNGNHLAARREIAGDIVVFKADGTGLQVALPRASGPGVSYGPPVWVGSDRILVVEQRATIAGPTFRFLDIRAPGWTVGEYAPFDGVIPPGHGFVSLLAPAAGDRLYLQSCTDLPSWSCRIVEYPIDGAQGTPRLAIPEETIGGFWVLSPDGNLVATQSGDQIIIFDLRTGQQVGELLGKPARTEIPVAWVAAEYP